MPDPKSRIATVRGKATDELTGESIVYLETNDGLARVVAPLPAWHGAQIEARLEVPDGDLEHPTISARITWPW